MIIKQIENRIKNQALILRKEKNRLGATLMTLLNDINMIGKNAIPPRNSTDEEAVRVIRKAIQIQEENLTLVSIDKKTSIETEILLLKTFLPKQLTIDELREIIINFVEKENLEKSPKSIGQIMKMLNKDYLGSFEPKIANEIIKLL
jgi:uncharacterized protein YqeY